MRQSNTYKLQKSFDWAGLLIEPSPSRFKECVANRTFGRTPRFRCAACVPFGFSERFVEIEDADLMSVAKGLNVSSADAFAHAESGKQFLASPLDRHVYGAVASPLSTMLDEAGAPKNFDLLSLEVEGNELAVLMGLDFSRYRPLWILAEVRGPEVEDSLALQGYTKHGGLSAYAGHSDVLFKAETRSV